MLHKLADVIEFSKTCGLMRGDRLSGAGGYASPRVAKFPHSPRQPRVGRGSLSASVGGVGIMEEKARAPNLVLWGVREGRDQAE